MPMSLERRHIKTARESYFCNMLLAVDIGNTNIVIALKDADRWLTSFRIFTDVKKTGDEYYVIISSLLRESGADIKSVDKVIISSVVPFLTRSFEKNMKRIFPSVEPITLTSDLNTGLDSSSIPAELGTDLLSNLSYAHYIFPDNAVMVIDFGTALTFSTVDEKGSVIGVGIVPGLITAVNALFGATAQLPQVELKIPSSVLGLNTEDSIRAGIMYGYAGLVKEMIAKTEKEIGRKLKVIATGGLSKTISPFISEIDIIDGFHTLNGLALIASLN